MRKPKCKPVAEVEPEALPLALQLNGAMLYACAVRVRAAAVEMLMPEVWDSLLQVAKVGGLEACVLVEKLIEDRKLKIDPHSLAEAIAEHLRSRGCKVECVELTERRLGGYDTLPRAGINISWRAMNA